MTHDIARQLLLLAMKDTMFAQIKVTNARAGQSQFSAVTVRWVRLYVRHSLVILGGLIKVIVLKLYSAMLLVEFIVL